MERSKSTALREQKPCTGPNTGLQCATLFIATVAIGGGGYFAYKTIAYFDGGAAKRALNSPWGQTASKVVSSSFNKVWDLGEKGIKSLLSWGFSCIKNPAESFFSSYNRIWKVAAITLNWTIVLVYKKTASLMNNYIPEIRPPLIVAGTSTAIVFAASFISHNDSNSDPDTKKILMKSAAILAGTFFAAHLVSNRFTSVSMTRWEAGGWAGVSVAVFAGLALSGILNSNKYGRISAGVTYGAPAAIAGVGLVSLGKVGSFLQSNGSTVSTALLAGATTAVMVPLSQKMFQIIPSGFMKFLEGKVRIDDQEKKELFVRTSLIGSVSLIVTALFVNRLTHLISGYHLSIPKQGGLALVSGAVSAATFLLAYHRFRDAISLARVLEKKSVNQILRFLTDFEYFTDKSFSPLNVLAHFKDNGKRDRVIAASQKADQEESRFRNNWLYRLIMFAKPLAYDGNDSIKDYLVDLTKSTLEGEFDAETLAMLFLIFIGRSHFSRLGDSGLF